MDNATPACPDGAHPLKALPNRVLMVMPYRQLVQKAAAQGLEVYSVWDPSLQTPEYLRDVAEGSAGFQLADFRDTEGLRRTVAEAAARHRVARVVHLGQEETMLPVALEAAAAGLAPNPPESLRRLNDKAAMRELLRDRGLSAMRTALAESPQRVAGVLPGFELPVIVKPTSMAGSRGVRLVRDRADLDRWTAELAGYGYTGPVLVEEYLHGPEFSVETLTFGGRHHVVGITAKQTTAAPNFVETGHIHPAPLPERDRAAVADLVTALLEAAGYRFGPAHTEVILTPAGPRIVESQARLGGDRIPLLVEIATGLDIESAIFRALAGRPVEIGRATAAGSIAFFQLPPGRLESVSGLDEIRALPWVRALKFPYTPGQSVPRTADSKTRHGYVVVEAADAGQAEQRARAAQELLRAVVVPHQEPAPAGAQPPTQAGDGRIPAGATR